jgi:hypothetical protein
MEENEGLGPVAYAVFNSATYKCMDCLLMPVSLKHASSSKVILSYDQRHASLFAAPDGYPEDFILFNDMINPRCSLYS